MPTATGALRRKTCPANHGKQPFDELFIHSKIQRIQHAAHKKSPTPCWEVNNGAGQLTGLSRSLLPLLTCNNRRIVIRSKFVKLAGYVTYYLIV